MRDRNQNVLCLSCDIVDRDEAEAKAAQQADVPPQQEALLSNVPSQKQEEEAAPKFPLSQNTLPSQPQASQKQDADGSTQCRFSMLSPLMPPSPAVSASPGPPGE